MTEDKKFGTTICRVCLNYDSENVYGKGLSLFEKYNDFVISDQINALSNVDIKEGDGLPDKICSTCLLELESAYKFKQKCENTNEILLATVNNVTEDFENFDVALPMKEEYLEDDDFDYLDDNTTLADLQADIAADDKTTLADLQANIAADDKTTLADLQADIAADIKPLIEPPSKPSKAIDLKLECHDCGGSFKSKCKLRVHWKRVHLYEYLKCSTCLRKFKSFAALKSHKNKNLQSCAAASKVRIEGEGRNRVFYCKDCDYKSVRIKDIAAHTVIHTGERPYQCDICLKTFTQLSSLTAHKENSHNIYNSEGYCQFCGKHFQGRSKLYSHMKLHKNSSIPCKICSTVLKSKEGLLNHMKRHSGVKAYACEMCATSFYTGSELHNHKTKVHLKNKFYTCEICNYKSFSHSTMARHKPKHTAVNFACNVCGTFWDNELQLALHKKRHTDRHHQCPQCDKTYFCRKNLSSHIRKVHKIVKLTSRVPTLKVNSIKSECSTDIQL